MEVPAVLPDPGSQVSPDTRNIVVVADAGMLSAGNLLALEAGGSPVLAAGPWSTGDTTTSMLASPSCSPRDHTDTTQVGR